MKSNELISILEEIWTTDIKTFFEAGKMCSERALQSELYSLLKSIPGYEIWVEPKLSIKDDFLNGKVPDVIITRDNEVIGIIELKYNLFQGIDCAEDIKKLIRFSELQGSGLHLKTNTKTGDWDREGYRIIEDTVYVLAVIAWAGTQALTEQVWHQYKKQIDNRFVHLIGEVNECINFKRLPFINDGF